MSARLRMAWNSLLTKSSTRSNRSLKVKATLRWRLHFNTQLLITRNALVIGYDFSCFSWGFKVEQGKYPCLWETWIDVFISKLGKQWKIRIERRKTRLSKTQKRIESSQRNEDISWNIWQVALYDKIFTILGVYGCSHKKLIG